MTGRAPWTVLSELPPGMPRVARLNGGLDTAELNTLAVGYAHFVPWVSSMLEGAARDGAVLVEVRFGVGAGLGPCHMTLFREAERRVRERHPLFYAEAIAAIRLSAANPPEAFESCLRAREQGLAGIDFIPDPYDSEADWTEAAVWAERAAKAGLGITVHAGEFSTANISAALQLPGISRIGHGVYATATDKLLQRVVRLWGHRRMLPDLEPGPGRGPLAGGASDSTPRRIGSTSHPEHRRPGTAVHLHRTRVRAGRGNWASERMTCCRSPGRVSWHPSPRRSGGRNYWKLPVRTPSPLDDELVFV